mgnify:CR=1 FL=1
MLRTLTFVTTLIVGNLLASSVMANNEDYSYVSYQNQDQFIRQKMREHIGYDPLLEVIAGCESTGDPKRIKHWDRNGNLVKNPNSSASGSLQVLLQYHSDWIDAEGRDMQDIDEYMMFVKTLFEAQGYEAWYPSKSCWGKYAYLATS